MERPRPLFLFALPRTGSTLLQSMLAEHSQISTANESWLLLPLLYSLKPEGVYAEYGHRPAVEGIGDLCGFMRGGRAGYLEEVKELAVRVYDRASPPGSAYFLDKTPRYHLVVEDILSLFNRGRFVFLWRNPLAVVASMVDSGPGLGPHAIDLFAGAANLVGAFESHRDHCLALRYEDLVEDPAGEMERIFAYLDVSPEAVALPIDRAPLTKWHGVLGVPLLRSWCRRYLRWLGTARLATMGYDVEELLNDLASIPARRGGAADLFRAAKQAAWPLLEPTMLRDKANALVRARRTYHHW